MTAPSTPGIGDAIPSQEGDALLRGAGRYAGDVSLDDALHLFVLRSPVAHADFRLSGLEAAKRAPGVHAVQTGEDLADLGPLAINPVLDLAFQPDFPVLARSRVAAVGQPLAAILATTLHDAADAAELIDIDFDTLPPDDPAPLATRRWGDDTQSAFNGADIVVEVEIHHSVLAPSPMEPRTVAVRYEPEQHGVTLWQSTQTPHRTRTALASILDLDPARVRVIASDVGGAFGIKGSVYPEEVLAVWAALTHRRNVRWTATRSEEFLSATHGRGLTCRGHLALASDGRFLALKARVEAPLGHWVPNSGLIPAWNAARVLPTGYDIPAVDIETRAVLSAHPPRGIYRGAGRPEANLLMERLVEKAAKATGFDPLDLRRRNLLTPDHLPHHTVTGNHLDSGDYAAMLDLLQDKAGYAVLLAQRDARRANGETVGVGVAFFLEPSGEGWESARVRLTGDGRAEIDSGSSAQGQFRKTAYAQIAASVLGLPVEAISVRCGDTGTCPEGIGALASRSTAIGGSAVLAACRAVVARRDAGENGPIEVELRYENDGQAWGCGVYLAVLSVDADTGAIALERMVCADDTGVVIHPELVRGQILGGLAQGLGEALLEELRFDDDGQLLTGSFMDYAMPRAADMPPVDLIGRETPSPFNLLGAKGVGEAGTIGTPAAILNAAHDALGPLGVTELTMPLTPCRVWQAIRTAKDEAGE